MSDIWNHMPTIVVFALLCALDPFDAHNTTTVGGAHTPQPPNHPDTHEILFAMPSSCQYGNCTEQAGTLRKCDAPECSHEYHTGCFADQYRQLYYHTTSGYWFGADRTLGYCHECAPRCAKLLRCAISNREPTDFSGDAAADAEPWYFTIENLKLKAESYGRGLRG